MQPFNKILLFLPILLAGAVIQDNSYRHSYAHPRWCTAFVFGAAFCVGTWGASLFAPTIMPSHIVYGLIAGLILAASVATVGSRHWRQSACEQREQ